MAEEDTLNEIIGRWMFPVLALTPLKASESLEGHPILKCCQPDTGLVYSFIDWIFFYLKAL